jgi:peptidoglycan/LPS O-acetylase OafA/YrhL
MNFTGQGGYRPEIDGLRAIAVLTVIGYHIGLPGAASGYTGVDVFFVISGFLIGGIVLRERSTGTFSYKTFYGRRARRILPALCATILVSLPFAWALMTPHQLRYFSGGIISTLSFLSNIWFYTQIDYFNPDAELSLLLHTWSLGVEEQFYLLFPPLVAIACFRHSRALPMVLLTFFFGSLVWAIATSYSSPTLAFYMPHTRMWEMTAGVLASLYLYRANKIIRCASLPLSVIGLLLVIYSATALPRTSGWSAMTTFAPVAGSVLIILFASNGPVFTILASRPLRAVGLISYSAYLIHHPLITILTIAFHKPETMLDKLAVVSATLLLAAVSWACVEQPFRRNGPLTSHRYIGLIAVVSVLVIFSVGGHITKGYPSRLPADAQEVLYFSESRSPTHDKCNLSRTDALDFEPKNTCLHNPEGIGPEVVIWGDSHVSVLTYQLAKALPHLPIREFSLGGCPPIPSIINILQETNSPVIASDGCSSYNNKAREYILANDDVKLVVLYSYWTNYTERRDFDTQAGYVLKDKLFSIPLESNSSISEAARLSFLTKQFSELVSDLTSVGKDVLIVYPMPISAWDLPKYVAWMAWKGNGIPKIVSYPKVAFEKYATSAKKMLDQAGINPKIHRIDLSPALCSNNQGCIIFSEKTPLFFDTNHLSQSGVARLILPLENEIRSIIDR